MSNKKRKTSRRKTGQARSSRQLAPSNINRIKVRSKRLDELDQDKVALAYWLLARQLVEDRTEAVELSEDNVYMQAESIDDAPSSEGGQESS